MTKIILRDSLLQLLKKKEIHQISIRELCDFAQINRSTFYKHYGSQYDLLVDMENELITEINEKIMEEGLHQNYLSMTELLTYCTKNIELCRLLFNSNIDPMFPKKVIYQSSIQNLLLPLLHEDKKKNQEYLYDFIVYGGYYTLIQWINKEDRETPEEMAKILISTITTFLGIEEPAP